MPSQTSEERLGSVVALEERREDTRRSSAGRRSGDDDAVTRDEVRAIQALIASIERAQDRDRQVYDEQISELKAIVATERIEREKAVTKEREARLKLTSRVLIATGAFVAMVFVLEWLGPTVIRDLLRGTP